MGRFQYLFAAGKPEVLNDDDETIWDGDYPPLMLLPDSEKITLTSQAINFPDFDKSNYMYTGWAIIASFKNYDAASYVTILPGEWGPDEAGAYELPRTLVGTVPPGTNSVWVRANLSRTTDPSDDLHGAIPKMIAEGEDIWLDGGCLILEQTNAFVRGVRFVVDGTDVYMERFQSVRHTAYAATPLKTGAQTWTSGGTTDWDSRWTHGGDARGHLAHLIEYLGATSTASRCRGRGLEPSTTDPTDYASVWTGDITIWPARADETDVDTPSLPAAPGSVTLEISSLLTVSAGSYSIWDRAFYAVNFGQEYAGRKIIMAVAARGSSLTSPAIGGVKINGQDATEIAAEWTGGIYYVGIWAIDEPEGEIGVVEILTPSATDLMAGFAMQVIAVSGLSSLTPVDTDTFWGTGTKTASVATVADGYVVGALLKTSGTTSGVTTSQQTDESAVYAWNGANAGIILTHDVTTGSAETLGVTSTSANAFCVAASFA